MLCCYNIPYTSPMHLFRPVHVRRCLVSILFGQALCIYRPHSLGRCTLHSFRSRVSSPPRKTHCVCSLLTRACLLICALLFLRPPQAIPIIFILCSVVTSQPHDITQRASLSRLSMGQNAFGSQSLLSRSEDKVDHSLHPLARFDRGENGRRPVAHRRCIPRHDAEVCTHQRGEVDLVDNEHICLRNTGASFPWNLIAPRHVDHCRAPVSFQTDAGARARM